MPSSSSIRLKQKFLRIPDDINVIILFYWCQENESTTSELSSKYFTIFYVSSARFTLPLQFRQTYRQWVFDGSRYVLTVESHAHAWPLQLYHPPPPPPWMWKHIITIKANVWILRWHWHTYIYVNAGVLNCELSWSVALCLPMCTRVWVCVCVCDVFAIQISFRSRSGWLWRMFLFVDKSYPVSCWFAACAIQKLLNAHRDSRKFHLQIPALPLLSAFWCFNITVKAARRSHCLKINLCAKSSYRHAPTVHTHTPAPARRNKRSNVNPSKPSIRNSLQRIHCYWKHFIHLCVDFIVRLSLFTFTNLHSAWPYRISCMCVDVSLSFSLVNDSFVWSRLLHFTHSCGAQRQKFYSIWITFDYHETMMKMCLSLINNNNVSL